RRSSDLDEEGDIGSARPLPCPVAESEAQDAADRIRAVEVVCHVVNRRRGAVSNAMSIRGDAGGKPGSGGLQDLVVEAPDGAEGTGKAWCGIRHLRPPFFALERTPCKAIYQG